MVDFELQRRNMIESQVRPSDVTDRRIIRAMEEIPREAFVPPADRSLSYMDTDIALTPQLAHRPARALVAPRTFAKLLQLADLDGTDVVLDIGCATGYSAAVLSRIARTVVALESDAGLAAEARSALAKLAITNVTVITGELPAGHADEGPYDAIVLEGAILEQPSGLLDQLKDGGRLVGIRIDASVGRGTIWRRLGQTFDETAVFDAGGPLLPGFERKPAFVF